jgi:hypothetical protein
MVDHLTMRLLWLLAALPLWGAEDANQILKRLAKAQDKNWEKARQYAYRWELTNFAYGKSVKPLRTARQSGKSSSWKGRNTKKLIFGGW